MSPRPDVSEERTHQILNAASEVFSKLGFYKARMEDIARQAEVSKGTLYLYFKSKDAIIEALMNSIFNRELEGLRALGEEESSAASRLMEFCDLAIEDMNNWTRLVPVAYEYLGLVFRNRLVQKVFKNYFTNYMNLITPIIQQGIDNGEFKPVSAKDVAVAAGAIFEGTILLWVYDSSRVDIEDHVRKGIQFIMEGIKA